MEKKLRKLALSRETLRTLEAPALSVAQGGEVQPAINTIDLLPRSYLCRTRFCPTDLETANCPIFSWGGCTEPTLVL